MTKNDGQNRGIDEAVSVGRGAYKAARLAEAASKGAAAGGIWGAAAGAAWEGRKHIGKLIAAVDGDNYEIVNPYEGNLVSNANIFLGEYCAAKDADWQSISKDDLEQILRDGKDQLYT